MKHKTDTVELAKITGYTALKLLGVVSLVLLPIYLVGKVLKWIFE